MNGEVIQDDCQEIFMDTNDDVKTVIKNRNKRRNRKSDVTLKFEDIYSATGEILGSGSNSSVHTYIKLSSGKEYAVKIITKDEGRSRQKVLKEIEIFTYCQGQANILELVEYHEVEDKFYLVFEKMNGGTLLENIQRRGHLNEHEASEVMTQLATAVNYLHEKGISHRDLKLDNILCKEKDSLVPVKICDFDLGSGVRLSSAGNSPVTTPQLDTPVGSAEYMAPEVVEAWIGCCSSYDKKCDLWSLGIILYIMLCGYPPFYGTCGSECGWEKGEACQWCQQSLFERIQDGVYDFPDNEWATISEEAKNLISHLLVRDPSLRYGAADVLNHPWIRTRDEGNKRTLLATPRVLMRNNSTKDLEAFAGDAVALNRMVLQHLTIAEPCAIVANAKSQSQDFYSSELKDREMSPDDTRNRFQICIPNLSPPGQSKLAKRRAERILRNCQSQDPSPPFAQVLPSSLLDNTARE